MSRRGPEEPGHSAPLHIYTGTTSSPMSRGPYHIYKKKRRGAGFGPGNTGARQRWPGLMPPGRSYGAAWGGGN